MRTGYNGVKYFSQDDMSIGWALKEAEQIIANFSENKNIETINEILELYNVQKLLESGVRLSNWTDETYKELKSKKCVIERVIATFFSKIIDENFIEYCQSVDIFYRDDFWSLFDYFKIYNNILPETFFEYIQMPDVTLSDILKHKNVVKRFDTQLAQTLRTSDQTCGILVYEFLESNNVKYYLPDSFKPNEYESIFQKYIDSDCANPNILKLIFEAQNSSECPISDRIRLNARNKYNEFWGNSDCGINNTCFESKISFVHQPELKKLICKGLDCHISYDVSWLEDNLDYPTIMNNFLYVFEFFDLCWRSTFVSVKSQISPLERILRVKGKKSYQRGVCFDVKAKVSSIQMLLYYEFLKTHDIDLETVFSWFFNEYLLEEFKAEGFFMKASSATDYGEKCRTLVSEMDGVLKQYRMYVRDGNINRDLFEMSSEQMIIGGIPSLIKDKYAYACGNSIQQEMFMLFSNQAVLSFTEKTQSKYPTLYELLKKEMVTIHDFYPHQTADISWLIERGTLITDNDEIIKPNVSRVGILKDLYDHDVICVQYLGEWTSTLYEMKDAGDIKIESTLFSEPEKKYLNFELNKSEYSDGLDLRNKYIHSSYSKKEYVNKHDYIELLKIMVLIITKINEEFCLREDRKKVLRSEL